MMYKGDEDVPTATNTVLADASAIVRGVFSIKAFWYDMRCRQRSWAHHGTLILGIMEIISAIAFCIVLHLHHAPMGGDGELCINQMTMVLGIAGLSQGFLTANGICMENTSMLVVSNLNGFYILGYLAMHLKRTMITPTVDIIVVSVFAAYSALHLGFSLLAWGGEFQRFIFYRVGVEEQTVRRYRFYQLLLAALVLDLVVTVTTCGNLLFMVDGRWWEYLVIALIIISVIMAQAAVRVAVRYERVWVALLALSTQTAVTAICAVALWYKQFMGVVLPGGCNEAPIVMFAIMAGTHAACVIVFLCCATFFGEGMKIIFARERAALEFVNDNYERHKLLAETFLSS